MTTRFFLSVFMALAVTSLDARMYRWVDDEGKVPYTDSIPPEYADQGRAEIDNRGFQRNEVAPAPTAEEIEERRRLERERNEEAARRAKQAQADKELLRKYPTLDDAVLAHRGQVGSGDGRRWLSSEA
jgi:hypothetical protein